MKTRVLVAYASKYGSTAEIATRIRDVLIEEGMIALVRPIDAVDDLNTFDAVVLGSAVYIGQWRKEALRFVRQHVNALCERPTWFFSTGPTGEGEPVELLKGWQYPENMRKLINEIQPRDVTLFHGDVNPDKLNILERWVLRNVGAPIGDYREWEDITTWARTIASELKAVPVPE